MSALVKQTARRFAVHRLLHDKPQAHTPEEAAALTGLPAATVKNIAKRNGWQHLFRAPLEEELDFE